MVSTIFAEDTILKQPTERSLYQKARYNYNITGDVVQIVGPHLIRHLVCARETVACTASSIIKVVELDIDVYNEQVNDMKDVYRKARVPLWTSYYELNAMWEPGQMLPIGHNVKFLNCNIADVRPTRFVDADLMRTQKNCGLDLIRTLRNQRTEFPLGTDAKAFIFTISLRGGGGLDEALRWTLEGLVPVIGSSCTISEATSVTKNSYTRMSKNGFRGISNRIYGIVSPSRPEILHDLTIYTYNDNGGPMLTGIIIYS